MKVIVATMTKNEADRYLGSALQIWSELADTILFLDDLSEDDTREIASKFDKVRNISPPSGYSEAWGDETRYRKYLFDYARDYADVGDVVIWLDADMIPMQDPREFFEETCFDSFYFLLYDLWDLELAKYRNEPPFWVGHTNPRLWAIRITEEVKTRKYDWQGRGIHCGHVPFSFDAENLCGMPPDFAILHYGYATPEDREDRDARYQAVSHQLTGFEKKHAATILTTPDLASLPHKSRWHLSRRTDRRIYT